MKNKIYISVILILLALSVLMVYKCVDVERENIILQDSLSTQVLKNGEIVKSKKALEINLKDLKHSNDSLYNQIKQLKEKPLIVEKIKIVYRVDTVQAESTLDSIIEQNSKKYNINWRYRELADNLNVDGITSITFDDYGNVKTYNTDINNLSLGISLVGVLTKTKKGYNYNVISNSKNVTISNIEGYVMNNFKPKPKKFGISIFGGPTYDFTNNNVGIGVGIGLSYDLIQIF